MAADEKDRYGDKMRDVEAAREDLWAHKQDEELLARMRSKLHEMMCPHCGNKLVSHTEHGVHMMKCPHERPSGAWLEAGELHKLLESHRKAGHKG